MKRTKTPATTAPQITAAEHFRLRLPTEKPTVNDADTEFCIQVYDGFSWSAYHYSNEMQPSIKCWLPGHLPAHLIPAPEDPLAKMRREFEEIANGVGGYPLERNSNGEYAYNKTREAFHFYQDWQAARKEAQP